MHVSVVTVAGMISRKVDASDRRFQCVVTVFSIPGGQLLYVPLNKGFIKNLPMPYRLGYGTVMLEGPYIFVALQQFPQLPPSH